jgi:hypothetical protein
MKNCILVVPQMVQYEDKKRAKIAVGSSFFKITPEKLPAFFYASSFLKNRVKKLRGFLGVSSFIKNSSKKLRGPQ